MSFGGLILTNRGKNLQSKAQTGVALQYTRIGVGDGYLGTTPILDLNALKNQVKSLSITKLKNLGNGRSVVGTVLSNQGIAEGFYFREIGVFAQDPDLGEILYCYGNAGELAEYIAPGGGADIIEKSIDVQTIVGNAQNVSAIIDTSLVWETVEGATEKTNIALAVANSYTDQEIGGKTIDDTLIPSTDTGLSVKILLSWLAHMIKSVTGKANWRTKPTKNLEELNTALDNKVDKVAGKHLSDMNYTLSDSMKLEGIEAGAQKNTVTSVAGRTGAVVLTKSDVGLSLATNKDLTNVDNVKQMPIAGGTLTGPAYAQANTAYTTAQLRNIILSTADASGVAQNGAIWIKYKA